MLTRVDDGPHRELMLRAIAREGDGHRAALAGDRDGASAAYREAAGLYRSSWELAPPSSYGRLVGMLKASVLAGEGADAAAYVRAQLTAEAAGEASPPAAYALAVAALIDGDHRAATGFAAAMREGPGPYGRAADAIAALAAADAPAYRASIDAIVADFAAREEHLTGVRIADTAAMLEALAAPRGLVAGAGGPLLPAAPL
jgi:hypothetical protein